MRGQYEVYASVGLWVVSSRYEDHWTGRCPLRVRVKAYTAKQARYLARHRVASRRGRPGIVAVELGRAFRHERLDAADRPGLMGIPVRL